jgi:hypothetical protein
MKNNKLKKFILILFMLSIPVIYKYSYINNKNQIKYLDYFNNMDIIEKNMIKMYSYSYPYSYIIVNMFI